MNSVLVVIWLVVNLGSIHVQRYSSLASLGGVGACVTEDATFGVVVTCGTMADWASGVRARPTAIKVAVKRNTTTEFFFMP